MVEQTTNDGITVEQIDATYEVLEVLRENLQADDMNNLSEIVNEAHYLVQQYDEGARWTPDYDMPHVGDILVDPESNPRFGDGRVEVTEVTNQTARQCRIKNDRNRSVAYHNPSHPEDAPVVKGRYVDGSEKVYKFPVTRLQE